MPDYIQGNPESKTFILVLHGAGSFGLSFRDGAFPEVLEENYVVVYWDQRGHGMSQGQVWANRRPGEPHGRRCDRPGDLAISPAEVPGDYPDRMEIVRHLEVKPRIVDLPLAMAVVEFCVVDYDRQRTIGELTVHPDHYLSLGKFFG